MKYVHFRNGYNPLLRDMEQAFTRAWNAATTPKDLYDRYTGLYAQLGDGQYWQKRQQEDGPELCEAKHSGLIVELESCSLALELAVRQSGLACDQLDQVLTQYRELRAQSDRPGEKIPSRWNDTEELHRHELLVGEHNTLLGERLSAFVKRQNRRYADKNKGFHCSKYATLSFAPLQKGNPLPYVIDVSRMVYIPFQTINFMSVVFGGQYMPILDLETGIEGAEDLLAEGTKALSELLVARNSLHEEQYGRNLEQALKKQAPTDKIVAAQAGRRSEYLSARLSAQEMVWRLKERSEKLGKLLADAIRYSVGAGKTRPKLECMGGECAVLCTTFVSGDTWPFDGPHQLERRVLLNNLVWVAALVAEITATGNRIASELAADADAYSQGAEAVEESYASTNPVELTSIDWKSFHQLLDRREAERELFLAEVEADPDLAVTPESQARFAREVHRAVADHLQDQE